MIRTLDLSNTQRTLITTKEYSRILSAAVINKQFRRKLLADPLSAITNGYSGETFELNKGQQEHIAGIRAGSLSEFAAQLA